MAEKKADKLYEQVFQALRGYILENGLQPGDQLPTEQVLCEKLGASRTVIREAIKAMDLMGMTRSVAGRGTELRPFNLHFLLQSVLFSCAEDNDVVMGEMLNIRKHLELGFMGDAYEAMGEEDIREVRRAFEGMAEHVTSPFQVFHPIDCAFHMAIFRPLNNRTLLSELDAIWKVDAMFRSEDRSAFGQSDVHTHENIVVALEGHNKEAFEAAMRLHYSGVSFAVKLKTVTLSGLPKDIS